jgi:hypothetical protein
MSSMRVVFEAIETGCTYRREVMDETKLKEGQVKSAIWNLTYIGAIQRVIDENGRSRYVLPQIKSANCLCGVNSIFNVR